MDEFVAESHDVHIIRDLISFFFIAFGQGRRGSSPPSLPYISPGVIRLYFHTPHPPNVYKAGNLSFESNDVFNKYSALPGVWYCLNLYFSGPCHFASNDQHCQVNQVVHRAPYSWAKHCVRRPDIDQTLSVDKLPSLKSWFSAIDFEIKKQMIRVIFWRKKFRRYYCPLL